MQIASILLLAAMSLTEPALAHASDTPKPGPSGLCAEGELLVKFKDGPSSYAAYMGHATVGAEVHHTFGEVGWQHVKLPEGMTVADGLAYYEALETVAAVEPNHVRRRAAPARLESTTDLSAVTAMVPNDPKFSEQWALAKIGATKAWDITTGSTNVVVAVICTGVDYTHEDLAANMWRNPGETGLDENGHDKAANGIDDDGDGYVDDVYGIDSCNHDADPMDDDGHDTGCAGIIGAVGNNGKGIAGLNWHVQIMALKSHNSAGLGLDSAVIEAFDYVIMMKKRGVNIRVTNNSYGGDENGQAIKDAIDAAGNLGILNVFSAGNEAQDLDVTPSYPASFDSPSILSVAATDSSDNLAGFSNYGRTSVDLAAPGVGITVLTLKNQYASGTGTSFAAPHVAGAAALLLAVAPDLSVADLKSALLGTVDYVPGLTNKVAANGRLNLARALQFLVDPNAPSIVTSVLPSGNRTPHTARVELTFTKPMDHASVEAGFSLTPSVAGAFEWSNNDRTVTFIPDAPLSSATSYTGKLLGSANDTTGVTLDGNFNRVAEGTTIDDFTWGFRTTPPNDDFAVAEPISGGSGSIAGTNENATREPGEPAHAKSGGGASIWYRWTAPNGDSVTFDTVGTGFDTVLAVYSGDRLGALAAVAGNDDYAGLTTSRLTFVPVAGLAYFVAVDGKTVPDINRDAPPMGSVVLNWYPTPPPVFHDSRAFTPTEAVWGAQVTLNGTNFTGVTRVLIDGLSAKFTNDSDLEITATVPMGAFNGPIAVQTPHGNVTSTTSLVAESKVSYTVSRAEPTLWVDWAGNGFALDYTVSLGQPTWKPVLQTPTTVEGGQRTVLVLPLEGQSTFYRWRKD